MNDQDQASDLLTCPFCGAEAVEIRFMGTSLHGEGEVEYLQIKCSDYCCAGMPSEHHGACVDAWNRRMLGGVAPSRQAAQPLPYRG